MLYADSFNYITLARRVDCLSVRRRYAAGSLLESSSKET